MENIKESVAYLQGLARGLHLDEEATEGKILGKMLDVLEDMATEVETVKASHNELEEYVVAVDADLSDLEEEIYDEEDAQCHEDFVELQCPSCKREISFHSALLEEKRNVEVTCPYCGKVVYDNIIDGDCVYTTGENYDSAPGL